MYVQLLQILFAQDHRFLDMRTEGIPDAVRESMTTFWADPAYTAINAEWELVPTEWPVLVQTLEELARGVRPLGADVELWREIAKASEKVSETQPVAGTLVSLQALGAWVGFMGDHLFVQPCGGHNPDWHHFPLISARNLVAAEAIWAAEYLCNVAVEFIESAKEAPSHPVMRGSIAEYESALAAIERIKQRCVAELAWALYSSAGTDGENFRAELAALFWTVGDIPRARLLAARGPKDYLPQYAVIRDLIYLCVSQIPQAPLIQSILLEMKDCGPFDLRQHRVLFGRINNVFIFPNWAQLELIMLTDIRRDYARVAIGAMRDNVADEDRRNFLDCLAKIDEFLQAQVPDVYVQAYALLSFIDAEATPEQTTERWRYLAGMSAGILDWADRNGIYEPYGRVLDTPFYPLPVESIETLESTIDLIEAYRQANLGYWLLISPPFTDGEDLAELLEEEQTLLKELRGARFIRLLPHLPNHYRRYGVNLSEALAGPPSDTQPASKANNLMGFDPFDQNVGNKLLNETRSQLEQLFKRMQEVRPDYADSRLTPPSSRESFIAALNAHSVVQED